MSSSNMRLTTDMMLVHKVFRRELRMLPRLVAGVGDGDSARSSLLAAHYRELSCALRHHNSAEENLLWRRLDEWAPLDESLKNRLRACHREQAGLMTELDGLVPLWEQDADLELRSVLHDILVELSDAVDAHLDAVEEFVLPLVDRHVSAPEWLALGLRAASWIPLNRMAWMLGAMLEDATPAERTALMSKVPAPARLLFRMVGKDQYAREMRSLRGELYAA